MLSPEERAAELDRGIGYSEFDGVYYFDPLQQCRQPAREAIAEAIRAAVAGEREACAALAEGWSTTVDMRNWNPMDAHAVHEFTGEEVAELIRARATPPVVTTIPDLTIPKGGDPFAPEVVSLCEKALALTRLPEDPPSGSS